MATMDVFNGSAFDLTALSGAVDNTDYKPQLLGELGLFEASPTDSKNVFVDQRDGELALIQTSERGSPVAELARDARKAVSFVVPRIAKGETIYAAEVANWRAFGTENESTRVATEYNRRMERVRKDIELTHENMRLGALKGILLDADGSTIYNYFTEFGVTEAGATSFELEVATTDVRGICNAITRSMARSSKGAFTSATTVHALAGDAFYDALILHPQVRETYTAWSAAADLRAGGAFQAFTYGGITFHNYRGTDDGTTVGVATDEVKFFPVGAEGVFKHIMAPADEFMPYVGAPGQNVYSMNVRDTAYTPNDRWVRNEQYSYPLFMCQKPNVLRKGTRT